MTLKLSTLIRGMSSEEYHSTGGTFSSSQLKDLLDNPEIFREKHIAKTIEKQSNEVFDLGTYFHTAILEPHLLKKECAVYPGTRRFGSQWEIFKKKNKGKAIIILSQKRTAEKLISAIKNSPQTMKKINAAESEVSLFVKLRVANGKIYAVKEKKVLTRDGWEDCEAVPKKGTDVIIKVRADKLGKKYVLDLKSTSGNAKSPKSMRTKVSEYGYDLSAALYLDIFSLAVPSMKDFIWAFASKDVFNAKSYRASPDNILIGRAKWSKALLTFAKCEEAGWEEDHSIGVLEPQFYEREYLAQRAEDIL